MKRFYFVRHGESRSNATQIMEGGEAPLSQQGQQQSEFLAERFSTIDIDLIIASPFVRTRHTAEIFNKKLGKPVVYSDLIVERRKPSQEYGRHIEDPERVAVREAVKNRQCDPNWRFSDEENFTDLKDRALKALDYLSQQESDTVAVITHGVFLKFMVSTMLLGENLTCDTWSAIHFGLTASNTGITLCQYEPGLTATGWRILTWNDHAHLGNA